jgi:hypothetical protein
VLYFVDGSYYLSQCFFFTTSDGNISNVAVSMKRKFEGLQTLDTDETMLKFTKEYGIVRVTY